MRKVFLAFVAVAALSFGLCGISFASDNAILASLRSDGVATQQLDDSAMSEIRGTGYVTQLPYPSCMTGIREYHVTYKQFGSMQDYRSYNIVSYTTSYGQYLDIGVDTRGRKLFGVGDIWLADTKSNPYSWYKYRAVLAEQHIAVMFEQTPGEKDLGRTNLGYTESYWNRPLRTFSW